MPSVSTQYLSGSHPQMLLQLNAKFLLFLPIKIYCQQINILYLQVVSPQLQTIADRCGGGGGGWNRNRYGVGSRNGGGGSFKRGTNFGRSKGQGDGGHKRFGNDY